jgi:hypothetical protein
MKLCLCTVYIALASASNLLRGNKEDVLDKDTKVQVVTFATPFRLTTNFARVNGEALVATMPSDFEQQGFDPLVNLGMGKTWTGNYQEKITFLKAFLGKPENKEKIVIFADGEDVIMGGCDKAEMLEKYHKISKKSGAKIVFGAELWCFEPPNGECPEPKRATWAAQEYGDSELDEKLRGFQNEQSFADKTTSLINLNSGFFMGPADELYKMMSYASDPKMWFKLHNGTDYYGDQRMYSQYWFENPDKVTLDYGAELVLTANGFKKDALEVDHEGKVQNLMFKRTQCVVHGNGYAKSMVGDLQMQRAHTKGEKAVELVLKAHCLAMPETCSEGQKALNQIKDVKNSFAKKDLKSVMSDAEDQLKLLKTADPLGFKSVMENHVSNNPVFLQLAEQLL